MITIKLSTMDIVSPKSALSLSRALFLSISFSLPKLLFLLEHLLRFAAFYFFVVIKTQLKKIKINTQNTQPRVGVVSLMISCEMPHYIYYIIMTSWKLISSLLNLIYENYNFSIFENHTMTSSFDLSLII